MRRLKITHYLQDPAHCVVGACAAVANYYNEDIDYEFTKALAHKRISKKIGDVGLDAGQACLLLNYLGFYKVTIISSDLTILDFEWEKYGKRKMKEALKYSMSHKKDKNEREETRSLYKWYTLKGYENIIKIDFNFAKYIRRYLNRKKPVMITFNWNKLFRFPKEGKNGKDDPINGCDESHAVVASGYDDKGVWIVDSHHDYYKYKRKKYRRGFYKISWEELLVCMGEDGDVVVPEDYYILE